MAIVSLRVADTLHSTEYPALLRSRGVARRKLGIDRTGAGAAGLQHRTENSMQRDRAQPSRRHGITPIPPNQIARKSISTSPKPAISNTSKTREIIPPGRLLHFSRAMKYCVARRTRHDRGRICHRGAGLYRVAHRHVRIVHCTIPGGEPSLRRSHYFGPSVSPTFTYAAATCGSVSASINYSMNVGFGTFTVPINATACFP